MYTLTLLQSLPCALQNILKAPLFILLLCFIVLSSKATAQVKIPNVQQGQPGTLLKGPVDPDMGRLANIQFLGGHIITIPETPGSEPGDHQRTQAWNIGDPTNPVKVGPTNPDANFGDFGQTGNPILAHGTYSRANEVFISENGNNAGRTTDGQSRLNAVRLNDNGSLSHVRWSGPTAPELFKRIENQPGVPGEPFSPRRFAAWWTKGALMQPWSMHDSWSYNTPREKSTLSLRNILMAEWNITAETGASGFGNFLGNLMIYVSDQLRGGVAIYDATDIRTDSNGVTKPRLLDYFNLPNSQGGVGGYWSEISGHYIVIGRDEVSSDPNSFDGIQVINFEDPTDIKLQCQTELKNPEAEKSYAMGTMSRYIGLQDEYAFVDSFKVNIETCEVETIFDVTDGGNTTDELCVYPNVECPKRVVNSGEYARVVGNLLVTGGFPTQPNIDGMSIWVHQSAPDRRGPYIAHQIPQPNQTNYPIIAPLGFSIPETLKVETIITSENRRSGQTDSVTVTEVDDNGDLLNNGLVAIDYVLSHQGILTLNPVNLLKPDTTYEVRFSDAIEDAVGNSMTASSFRFSTGNSLNDGGGNSSPATISGVDVSPSASVDVNETVTVSVNSPNANRYKIALDSETGVGFSAQSSRSFSFPAAGTYGINVRARNDDGDSELQRVTIQVNDSNQVQKPGRNSSQLVCDSNNNTVWAVNPDNSSVAVFNAKNLNKYSELKGVNEPHSSALVGNEVWVSSNKNDRITIYDAGSRKKLRTINAGFGTGPSHVLASPDEQYVYVSFYNTGQLARYAVDGSSSEPDLISLKQTAQALALTPDGKTLLVARLISPEHWGEVYAINTDSWSLDKTYRLRKRLVNDALNEGRGKPNYLTSIVVNGAGSRAYVVAKKDNIDRGLLNANDDLDPDNTVRTLLMTIDLERQVELTGQRVDLDNTASLSALAMSADSRTLYVAEQGRNAVRSFQIGSDLRFTGQSRSFATGLAPQGLCFDDEKNKLFVKNFTDRSVTALDFSGGSSSATSKTASTVANEVLSAPELRGLKLFYNAFEGLTESQPVGRMSAEGYISCASCHLGGGSDGNTWDFTGRGEGLRNNISLLGRSGLRLGLLHWSANFDEVQDFEHDIRGPFGGRGFIDGPISSELGSPKEGQSQALDDLAAYVSSLGKQSLSRSSERTSSGSLTTNARAGKRLFFSEGCQQCHAGRVLTDAQVHDVGTLRDSSGERLGELLDGIKTPSLLGALNTAPYLHDGSAETLEEVFNTVGGSQWQFQVDNDPDAGTYDYNGENVQKNGYSYLRGGQAVRLNGNGALVGRFENYSDGRPGPGKLRVRYGSALTGGKLDVLIADQVQATIDLKKLPRLSGQSDALFTESASVDVDLPATEYGFNIAFVYRGSSSVVIDDFTVSNTDDLAKAEPHIRASRLSNANLANLISYIKSIDRYSAPSDDAAIDLTSTNSID